MPKKTAIEILTRDQADQALQRIGQFERAIAASEQTANDQIDALRELLVEETAPLRDALKENVRALEAWAKGDRKTWAQKTLDLVWGSISFRTPPPAIRFCLSVETIIERLRAYKMTTCIRKKYEVDKEALENYDDDVIHAVGCERKQGKDKFYWECKQDGVK